MKHWNVVLGATSNVEIIEHGVDMAISQVSPAISGYRKRSLLAGTDGYDDKTRRHISDVHSPMTLPVCTALPMSSQAPLPTKRNRFNLSRYQLGDDEDGYAIQSAVSEDVNKPNRFKTQMERLRGDRESEEESGSTDARGYEERFPSHEGEENSSESCDCMISPRARLLQFRDEHSHHVTIPNQWEGEKNLHEYVAFGTIEDALRPLGLMVARAALVNDSVATTRLHRHL